MSLLRVELNRLRWRRAVVLLLLGCVVVPVVMAAVVIWNTRPVSEAELADARATVAGDVTRCEKHPGQYGVPRARAAERCEDLLVGWQTSREQLGLRAQQGNSGVGLVALLTLLLMLAATTFAGHDWSSGSMSNQLLFRPRRDRVWLAKAAVVTGLALVLAAVLSTAYWLALWVTMRSRGLLVADGALVDSLALGLRGAGFAAAAALGCYALTMLLRSTVATLGVLFAVAVVGGLFVGSLGIGGAWQPQYNAAAIVHGGTTYWVDVPDECDGPRQPDLAGAEAICDSVRDLPLWRGTAYYGAALVLVVGGSVISFRRRDLT